MVHPLSERTTMQPVATNYDEDINCNIDDKHRSVAFWKDRPDGEKDFDSYLILTGLKKGGVHIVNYQTNI